MKTRLRSIVVPATVAMLVSLLGFDGLSAQGPTPRAANPPSAPLVAIADQVSALFPRVSGEVIEVQGSSVTLGIGKRDDGAGFGLVVELKANLPGLSQEQATDLVHRADVVCPYSHAIRGNVQVTLSV